MAAHRLDDLERRLTELEARLAGLAADVETLQGTVDERSPGTEPADTGDDAPDDGSTAASPANAGGGDGSDDLPFAPPRGASQSAVDDAVRRVEADVDTARERDREDDLLV